MPCASMPAMSRRIGLVLAASRSSRSQPLTTWFGSAKRRAARSSSSLTRVGGLTFLAAGLAAVWLRPAIARGPGAPGLRARCGSSAATARPGSPSSRNIGFAFEALLRPRPRGPAADPRRRRRSGAGRDCSLPALGLAMAARTLGRLRLLDPAQPRLRGLPAEPLRDLRRPRSLRRERARHELGDCRRWPWRSRLVALARLARRRAGRPARSRPDPPRGRRSRWPPPPTTRRVRLVDGDRRAAALAPRAAGRSVRVGDLRPPRSSSRSGSSSPRCGSGAPPARWRRSRPSSDARWRRRRSRTRSGARSAIRRWSSSGRGARGRLGGEPRRRRRVPAAAPARAVTLVGPPTTPPVAALVHDAALADQRELLDGVVRVLGLALENERLGAEVRSQLARGHRSPASGSSRRRRPSVAASNATSTTARSSGSIGAMLAIQQARASAERRRCRTAPGQPPRCGGRGAQRSRRATSASWPGASIPRSSRRRASGPPWPGSARRTGLAGPGPTSSSTVAFRASWSRPPTSRSPRPSRMPSATRPRARASVRVDPRSGGDRRRGRATTAGRRGSAAWLRASAGSADRVMAVGGRLDVESPPGGGTTDPRLDPASRDPASGPSSRTTRSSSARAWPGSSPTAASASSPRPGRRRAARRGCARAAAPCRRRHPHAARRQRRADCRDRDPRAPPDRRRPRALAVPRARLRPQAPRGRRRSGRATS